MLYKYARDFVNQPAGFKMQSRVASKMQSIGTKSKIDPMLKYHSQRTAGRWASKNPRRESMFIQGKVVNHAFEHHDRINKDLPGEHFFKIKHAASDIKEMELYNKWKMNPNNEQLIEEIFAYYKPVIQMHVFKWKSSGVNPTLLEVKAKEIIINSFEKYNPNSGVTLNTHVNNQMQQLSRFVTNNQSVIRTPEEKVQAYRLYLKAKNDIEATTGQKATNAQIKEYLGPKFKLSDFQPINEQFYSGYSELNLTPVMDTLTSFSISRDLFVKELDKIDQYIFNNTYTANPKPNQVIAKELGISPPAVTKRKRKIEQNFLKFNNSLQNFTGF